MKHAADPSADQATGASPAAIPTAARDLTPIIDDALGRIHKRAQQDIEARRKKLTPEELDLWWAEYRTAVLHDYAARVLAPIAAILGRDTNDWANEELQRIDNGIRE